MMTQTTQRYSEVTYPIFFVTRLLREIGWPRTTGLIRRRPVVSTYALKGAFSQLNKVGVVLGATEPKVGLQLLGDIFAGREWDAEGVQDLFDFLDPTEPLQSEPGVPIWAVLNSADWVWPDDGPSSGNTVPMTILSEVEAHISGNFTRCLAWGLTKPQQAANLVNEDISATADTAALWSEHGLNLKHGVPGDLDTHRANALQTIEAYQEEIRVLNEIPEALQNHAIAIGIARRTDIEFFG